MRLLAISDLHISYPANREALEALPPHPEDWLIVAGDVGESPSHLRHCWSILTDRFARVIWTPGNHELYCPLRDSRAPRGDERYRELVVVCREFGVATPEDPYLEWPGGEDRACSLVPVFLLYDYSFAPDGMTPAQAVDWAADRGISCTDEMLLDPKPFVSRQAWCRERLEITTRRLDTLDKDADWILINHFPLRRDLVRLFRVPRFLPWCGTRATEDWHIRYPFKVVVTGHLHMRATDWRDGVRFEEVSLGYPRNWRRHKGIEGYLREILPGPSKPRWRILGTSWHR